ncbi:MAG: ArsR/SmtB family transcription factor [Acidimicrobiales bacterium]
MTTGHMTNTTTIDVGCCAPVLADELTAADADELAGRFKAIADPVRLRILNRLAGAGAEGVCVCDVVAGLDKSQPTISHHLKVLTEAGLVERDQRGKWAWYTVDEAQVASLREALA